MTVRLRQQAARESVFIQNIFARNKAVEFNRNQFFMIGVFLLLIGVQFRLLDSVTLNEKTTRFLASRSSVTTSSLASIMPTSTVRKVIHPPQWLGWALMSVGGVCILHSLAMKKPGG
jgi:hypothetical protein